LAISIQSGTDAFGIIDVQPTFMPGGSLPTPNGNLVLTPINDLLQRPFGVRFATQDWHPPGHVSFASRHAGYSPMQVLMLDYGPLTLWPDHALQGTKEASLHAELDTSLLDLVLRKGTRPEADGLSAFGDCGGRVRSGLAPLLRERGIERLFLAGLALDLCVAATAEDAAREGFATYVVENACRASKLDLIEPTRHRLLRVGVQFVTEAEFG
jgi:nicotinamidase/pyrazinamidase